MEKNTWRSYKFSEKAPIISIGVWICGGYIVKRKGKFKILVVIIIGIVLLVIPITIQAKGEVSKNVLDKYVVIGDEISLEANNDYEVSYVSLIKDFLYALNDNLEYINLSNDGATSSQLLNVVDSNKEKLKDADLITISIGGNNILSAVLKSLNINEESLQDYDENKFDAIISEYLNSEEVKTEILSEISIFSKDFPNIIKKINIILLIKSVKFMNFLILK